MTSAPERKWMLCAESDRRREALAREWTEFREDVDAAVASVKAPGGWLGTALGLLTSGTGRRGAADELGSLVRLGVRVARLFRRR